MPNKAKMIESSLPGLRAELENIGKVRGLLVTNEGRYFHNFLTRLIETLENGRPTTERIPTHNV